MNTHRILASCKAHALSTIENLIDQSIKFTVTPIQHDCYSIAVKAEDREWLEQANQPPIVEQTSNV